MASSRSFALLLPARRTTLAGLSGALPDALARDISFLTHAAPCPLRELEFVAPVLPKAPYALSLDPSLAPCEVIRPAPHSRPRGPPVPVGPRGYVPPQCIVKTHSGTTPPSTPKQQQEAAPLQADDSTVLFVHRAVEEVPEAPAWPEALGFYGACLVDAAGGSVDSRLEFHGQEGSTELAAFFGDLNSHVTCDLEDGDSAGSTLSGPPSPAGDTGSSCGPATGVDAFLRADDAPALYVPLTPESGGALLLAKRVAGDAADTATASYAVSAFEIPYGSAVYVPPRVLCDPRFLIGDYLVVTNAHANYTHTTASDATAFPAIRGGSLAASVDADEDAESEGPLSLALAVDRRDTGVSADIASPLRSLTHSRRSSLASADGQQRKSSVVLLPSSAGLRCLVPLHPSPPSPLGLASTAAPSPACLMERATRRAETAGSMDSTTFSVAGWGGRGVEEWLA